MHTRISHLKPGTYPANNVWTRGGYSQILGRPTRRAHLLMSKELLPGGKSNDSKN